MTKDLNPQRALIFRIMHRDNVPWVLDNGLHCRNSDVLDADYVNIGNLELIDKRAHRMVPCAPGGTLSDYVPFYFTPFSPMMLNIKTGYGGIQRRSNEEIVTMVSSLHKLREHGVLYLFTDRHAYLETAQFNAELDMLDQIDWPLLQKRDFRKDPDDPGKFERYQAEALAYKHLPLTALLGVATYDDTVASQVRKQLAERGQALKVATKREWYF